MSSQRRSESSLKSSILANKIFFIPLLKDNNFTYFFEIDYYSNKIYIKNVLQYFWTFPPSFGQFLKSLFKKNVHIFFIAPIAFVFGDFFKEKHNVFTLNKKTKKE